MLGSIRTPKQWETYMQHRARFSPDVLKIDAAAETYRICEAIKDQVQDQLRRRGVVLGLSGGIDSSVTAALCVRALGATRVFGVLMPERDSEPDSTRLGRVVAELLKVETILEDIAPILDAAGCYRRRDEFMRLAIPEYGGVQEQNCPAACGGRLPVQHLLAPRGGSQRGAEKREAVARGLLRHRRRDQHEAADAQADRVLPRRSVKLRGGRHAQPA